LIGVIRFVRSPSDWGSVARQANAKQSPRGSTKSIYTWQRLFSRPVKVIQEVDAQADEIRRLKRDLVRVMEERDILKKATAYFARESPLSRM
jgi:transposase